MQALPPRATRKDIKNFLVNLKNVYSVIIQRSTDRRGDNAERCDACDTSAYFDLFFLIGIENQARRNKKLL